MSFDFTEGSVFCAKIIDQMVANNRDGDPQLVVTFKLEAQLKNPKRMEDGTVECSQLERDLRITMVGSDDNRLEMAVRDLDRLGFTGEDISQLHPDHPECVSLIGKEVFVRCKMVNDTEFWNLAWVRQKPQAVNIDALAAPAAMLKAKLGEARERLKNKNRRTSVACTAMSPAVPF